MGRAHAAPHREDDDRRTFSPRSASSTMLMALSRSTTSPYQLSRLRGFAKQYVVAPSSARDERSSAGVVSGEGKEAGGGRRRQGSKEDEPAPSTTVISTSLGPRSIRRTAVNRWLRFFVPRGTNDNDSSVN